MHGWLQNRNAAVGGITTHILKSSNFANLYLKNMNKTCMSGLTSEGRGFTLNSNKTNYSGHLCEGQHNLFEDNPFRTDGDPANSWSFWIKSI